MGLLVKEKVKIGDHIIQKSKNGPLAQELIECKEKLAKDTI